MSVRLGDGDGDDEGDPAGESKAGFNSVDEGLSLSSFGERFNSVDERVSDTSFRELFNSRDAGLPDTFLGEGLDSDVSEVFEEARRSFAEVWPECKLCIRVASANLFKRKRDGVGLILVG